MKVLTIFALLLMIGLAFARQHHGHHDAHHRNAFTNWMIKHKKTYSNHEFHAKYDVFKKNLDFIQEWNKQNSGTVLGLNVHADLSREDYAKYYLGTKFDATHLLSGRKHHNKKTFDTPATIDWRSTAVTHVKDQGQCGSCWSFSTTGAIEGAHQIAKNELISLSEQQLLDCSSKFGNQGCNGGLMPNAFKYVIKNNGIETEATYPYETKVGKCRFNSDNVAATISSYVSVSAGSESALEEQLTKGPVAIAIDASHQSFQLYKSGVYVEKACSSTNLDHGVLAVGYGTENGSDYFIVKNSWGPGWGMDGYILMARNHNNQCGVASMASQPVV